MLYKAFLQRRYLFELSGFSCHRIGEPQLYLFSFIYQKTKPFSFSQSLHLPFPFHFLSLCRYSFPHRNSPLQKLWSRLPFEEVVASQEPSTYNPIVSSLNGYPLNPPSDDLVGDVLGSGKIVGSTPISSLQPMIFPSFFFKSCWREMRVIDSGLQSPLPPMSWNTHALYFLMTKI